jgi:CheY-like chemotaxis protein
MSHSKILVVEDDRIVARDIQQQLSRIGHVVVGITARGEDVVSLATQSQPDLVLMDIRLEGKLDGIDVAQQIHERFGIPVIFLTAYADEETVTRARVTEPFGYLLKPFEDSQLRTTIEMALYKHAAERKLRESERRYAVTLSSIGDAVIATDELLRVTFMNPVAEKLTGWPQK